jgi:hypothetical protein
MTDPHRHSHADHGHDAHAHDHAHEHGQPHADAHPRARGGHAHASPAAVPAASMRWSVLSLSVGQRVLLVVPMVACLWLAVGWALSS